MPYSFGRDSPRRNFCDRLCEGTPHANGVAAHVRSRTWSTTTTVVAALVAPQGSHFPTFLEIHLLNLRPNERYCSGLDDYIAPLGLMAASAREGPDGSSSTRAASDAGFDLLLYVARAVRGLASPRGEIARHQAHTVRAAILRAIFDQQPLKKEGEEGGNDDGPVLAMTPDEALRAARSSMEHSSGTANRAGSAAPDLVSTAEEARDSCVPATRAMRL